MPNLRADVSTVPVVDGLVLLDERTGRYYQLNDSGAVVLGVLIDGGGEAEAADALTERYDVTREQALIDAAEVIHTLHTAGLIAP
ncbi:lasso peptide biosynthesis PqqD family chaperone [Streptomyces sp. UNOC14_S4]|uniref:lasso peptide biosynthesis PqqD family chaperone n=1 Tax=Streptomyces sp. UNOC14_S4 TaxID=2872340 RepID=UPI001E48C2E8|nr:lasso peptide biosynthesis PqqD family chaperone [Streptomyces sp. UNOC14_S4]MCC3768558.1 lasso peptide biosynthesis PqqD family chaperone [Streptomyces sp. UNOC14_S4]